MKHGTLFWNKAKLTVAESRPGYHLIAVHIPFRLTYLITSDGDKYHWTSEEVKEPMLKAIRLQLGKTQTSSPYWPAVDSPQVSESILFYYDDSTVLRGWIEYQVRTFNISVFEQLRDYPWGKKISFTKKVSI